MKQYGRFFMLIAFFALGLAILARIGVSYDAVDWHAYMNAYFPPGPFITVSPSSGEPGTVVTVSGRGYAGYTHANIMWSQSPGVQEIARSTPLNPDGTFSTQVTIPRKFVAGPLALLAYSTKETNPPQVSPPVATSFIVVRPPGMIAGRVTSNSAPISGAQVEARGPVTVTTTTSTSGDYTLANLPPGSYIVSVYKTGYEVPAPKSATVESRKTTYVDFNLQATSAVGPAVVRVIAHYNGLQGNDIGTFVSLPGLNVPVTNTFSAQLASGASAARVAFTLYNWTKEDTNGADGWSAQFNMSELPPGKHTLRVVAYNSAGQAGPSYEAFVHVLSKPAWLGQQWVLNDRATWEGDGYLFTAIVPNNPRLRYQKNINLSYLGSLQNLFESDIHITERLKLDGRWEAEAKGVLNVTILNKQLVNQEYVVSPSKNVQLARTIQGYTFNYSTNLYQKKCTVYESVIWSISGVATVKLSVDFGFNATLQITGNIRNDLSVEEIRFIPGVTPYLSLSVWADILLGVASAGATATPAFGFQLPVVYRSGQVYLDNPCLHFSITARYWAAVNVWFWKQRWEWGPSTIYSWSDPSNCYTRHASALQAQTAITVPSLFAAPSIATDGAGHAIALWIKDVDPNPDFTDPEVYYAYWNGVAWSAPQRLTNNERVENDPRVAFLAPNQAIAVWTQNKLGPSEAQNVTDLNQVLRAQELYYSLWDGTSWSPPSPITNDDRPDGLAALATDPARGKAMVIWVHDEDGDFQTRGDWEIYYSEWNGSNWSTPAPIGADSSSADAEVDIQYNSRGEAVAVWVRDHDADFTTNSDRHIVYATWNGSTWSAVTEPSGWPTGTLLPALAFDTGDNPLIIFTARGNGASGGDGLGNYDRLWSAYYRNSSWQVVPVGADTRAERPRVAINNQNQAIVVFRQFGEAGTVHFTGEVAAAVADLNQPDFQWNPTRFLSEDPSMDWQVAFAVDPTTMTTPYVHILDVKVASEEGAMVGQNTTASTYKFRTMGSDGDNLYTLDLTYQPDLVVTTDDIAFSNSHPMNGTTAVITATVHNLGLREAAGGFSVRFFKDDPSLPANLIGETVITSSMAFGVTRTVSIPWIAEGGLHPIYVVVDAGEVITELNEANNMASRLIGEVPPPRLLSAVTELQGGTIGLSWVAPDTTDIAGYWIFRSTTSGTGYKLVGSTTATTFLDTDLINGVTYYYVVTAYDSYYTQSAPSNEASAVPRLPYGVFLPIILKSYP
jgi:hypothetical protein